jgi:HK97 family phage prohead protease
MTKTTELERAAVDTSAWDGNAAMTACTSAADYEAICAGRRAGDPSQRQTWAFPHHMHPGDPPNADGVRNSLSRLPQTQGLTNHAAAQAHLDAHMAAITAAETPSPRSLQVPPRDDLVRAMPGGFELRPAADGGMPFLHGHFARFNEWTHIDSMFEGEFMERVAPGAFTKALKESPPKILFQHGKDPQIAQKPLAPLEESGEDQAGGFYGGRMLDTSYNRDLVPGLQAGLYGSSFRFSIVKQDLNRHAGRSAYNPVGLPERTVQEARLADVGPVTFPAYLGADAGVRSLTDDYILRTLAAEPERLARMVASLAPQDRSLEDLAAFLLADKAALSAAIAKLGNGEPLLAQEAELLEAAIEHLEPPDDAGAGNEPMAPDMQMNSAPPNGAERAHSEEPAPATPERASSPTARKPRPISREDFLAQLQETNRHV